jgi:Zn-finger nucleic acid-binding protein
MPALAGGDARRKRMKCPVCNVALLMTDKQGVEIDYCPTCRGIWLDRGELEKLVERMAVLENKQNMRQAAPYPSSDHHGHDKHSRDNHGYHHGKRETIWHKMFDF